MDTIPKSLIREFENIRAELLKTPYTGDIAKESQSVQVLLGRLGDYLHDRDIAIYHYTRADPVTIFQDGLKLETGEQRREWFLKNFSNHFTVEQIAEIESAWRSYFTSCQGAREGKIYFLLSLDLEDDGVWPLMEHFGGERIMMPLLGIPDVCAILKKLGKPLVVTARVKSSEIRDSYWEYPAAFVWLTAYHSHVNRDCSARGYVDGYVQQSIPPEHIVSVLDVSKLP